MSEESVRDKNAGIVVCDACPVICRIREGRTGACDRYGNLVFNKTARNFAPVMATAAKVTVVQVIDVVAAGELDPEVIVTPGVFVDRVVRVQDPAYESELVAKGVTYP